MNKKCMVCNKNEAIDQCYGCGAALCNDCRQLEIWGSGAEDLSAKYFCPVCKEDPEINPWGAYDKASDVEKTVHQVNAA